MIGEGLGTISEIFAPLRQWILVIKKKESRTIKMKQKDNIFLT